MRSPAGLLALLVVAALPAAAAPLAVYDDALRNGFVDWSWATHNLSQTALVRGGTAAVSFEPDGWQALFLHRDLGIDTAAYTALDFWIHGGAAGGQNLTIALTVGGSPVGSGSLAPFISGGAVPAGQWAPVHVPFASLGVSSGVCDGFWLQDATGGNQSAVYVDDVALVENTAPPPPPAPVAVSIDPNADRHPASPYIYGVNFGSAAQTARVHWPLRRWGGNSTTRYSWQHDISNHASDWFFYNIEEADAHPESLPDGSAADVFVDQTRAAGGQPLITVPTIGWTPIDRVRRWGFSVAKYGAQQQTECTVTGNASWCQPDAGNGLRPDGTPITGNDPHDTSREIGPAFVTGWMAHLAARTGTAGQGGVRYYALDNEPALWDSTHRDVHPSPLTSDELWQRTRDYAAAMKAQDPNARIFGPVSWGWCEYFWSALDGCAPGGPDAAAHGNLALTDWYLQQVKDYQTATGVRLIDVLDVHYYPQGTNISQSDDESAATAARRLRSLKSLYDPTYVDESWIGQPVRLIPRLKDWIAARLPGLGLAITEYSWGGDDGASSALAQAEALAIFGREGVDYATRWTAPADNSRVEDAFLLYLNYDGAGGKVSGDSVRAVSANVDAVGSYAVRSGDGSRLDVLLFNKDTADREADLQLPPGTLTGSPASLWRFDSGHRLGSAGTASPVGDALTLVLPARSATLAVLSVAEPPASDFYTVTPCRLLDTRNAAGPYGGPALAAGSPRSFALAGHCGVPADARALSLNVTVVGASARGELVAYPGGAVPNTSTISFAAGEARANNAVLPLAQDGNGTLSFRASLSSGTVHLILDVNGYFR